jgi:hypothetical protein
LGATALLSAFPNRFGLASLYLAEVRREVLIADPALEHVGPRPAELIDGGRAHGEGSFTRAA